MVTAVEAELGQVVASGTPIVRIAADGPRDVVFSVPEDKVSGIKPGMTAKVRGWAQNTNEGQQGQQGQQSHGATMMAKVREVSASADPATRTYQVKLALDAVAPPPLGATVYVLPDGLGGLQGMPVIKLPTSALRQEGQASAVWVLDKSSMTIKSQQVQIATADGNEAVIAAGLEPGMLVVSAGVHVLSPGQKVTIYQDKAPAGRQIRTPAAISSIAASALPAAAVAASR